MSAQPRTTAQGLVPQIVQVLEDIAAALAPLRDEIPGLQIDPFLNTNPNPPQIDIYPAGPFMTGAGFGIEAVQLFFTIRARVSTGDQEAAQMLLLRLLDPTDPASVEAAIEKSAAVVPQGVSEYREYIEDQPTNGKLLGCEWRVTTFL